MRHFNWRDFLLWIVAPFLLWVICFRSLIFGPLPEDLSGVSYGEKTVFLMTNFFNGGYPLWDPGYFNGFPFDFFLRRIGDANPFYLLVALAKLAGATDIHAYRFFLMVYFFIGGIGFWLLSCRIVRHPWAQFASYWVFLFSAWGTRVFCDYILLLFVPLVWFLYFLVAFFKEYRKSQLLGMILAAGIALTTYIPFFFITVCLTMFVFFLIFFGRELCQCLKGFFHFCKKNKLFIVLSCLLFGVMISPEIKFFIESKQGEFVMPGRNVASDEKSVLAVGIDHVKVGDIMSQGYFGHVFENQEDLVLVDFFVPYFFFIVFIISIVNPLTRKTLFLGLCVLFIGIFCVTNTSRIYDFLYQHLVVFKYMRMMSFLFWTAVFPLGILLMAHQLDLFLMRVGQRFALSKLFFIITAHVCFGCWALTRPGVIWLHGVALAFSLVFFIGVLYQWKKSVLCLFLCVAVILPSINMIRYAVKNDAPSLKDMWAPRPWLDKNFRFYKSALTQEQLKNQSVNRAENSIYCGTRWYQDIATHVPIRSKDMFAAHALYLMDSAQMLNPSEGHYFQLLSKKWDQLGNVAFLAEGNADKSDIRAYPGPLQAEVVGQNTPSVKVLRFSPIFLLLKTTVDHPRFLMWVDNYHSGWHVFINGVEKRLLRADHSYKGIWLPQGENIVSFRFMGLSTYLWRYFVWMVFFLVLVGIGFYAWKENRSSLVDENRGAM